MTETTETTENDSTETDETAEQLDVRMRAALGLDDPSTSTSGEPAAPYRTSTPTPVQPERSEFAAMTTDEREAGAWLAVVEAADNVNVAVEQLNDLPGERRAADQRYQQAVADAVRGGGPAPKPPKVEDFARRALELAGRHQGYRALYDQARVEYAAAARAALPGQAEQLMAAIPQRWQEAADAIDGARRAVAAIALWQGAIHAAAEAKHAAGEKVPNVRRRPGSPDPSALGRALPDAVAALTSDDPVISGSYLVPDGFEPSRLEREQMYRSGAGAFALLVALERSEDYRHTDLTRDLHREAQRGLGLPEHEALLKMAREGQARERKAREQR